MMPALRKKAITAIPTEQRTGAIPNSYKSLQKNDFIGFLMDFKCHPPPSLLSYRRHVCLCVCGGDGGDGGGGEEKKKKTNP